MSDGVAARLAAARAVGRVLRSGAYSNVLARSAFSDLAPPERRFAESLLYGTLRNRRRLDWWIDRLTEGRRLEDGVRDILRIGLSELPTSDPHAVVHSAVESVKRSGMHRAAGLVNAVLRRATREDLGPPESRELRWSVDPWLLELLDEHWGQDETDEFFAASAVAPPVGIRGEPPTGTDLVAAEVLGLPDAHYVRVAPEGAIVQDPASVAVGHAAAVSAGDRVFDMAAAPGGKTMHLADRKPRLLVAADRHPKRVAAALRRLSRAGYEVPWVVADGRHPPFPPESFDLVLLDAPCTGLGTLRRRPELRDRVDANGVERLAQIQSEMIDAALELVTPEGRVVYSVCTITAPETVEQVRHRNARPPDGIAGSVRGNGLLLAPHLTGTDGMFISIIRRR